MWHLIKNRASYVFMFVPMVLGCMLVPVTWAQFEEAPQLPTSHQPAPASVSEGRVGIAEMNNLLSGNTLKVRMINEEVNWSVFFQSGGLVFAKSEHGAQDTGQWWIDKGLYCTQYLQMSEVDDSSPPWVLSHVFLDAYAGASALGQLVMRYDLQQDLQLTCALSLPLGPPGSEYGGVASPIEGRYFAAGPSLFGQLAWYF